MATPAEEILNEAKLGRVTTVFCEDVQLGRRQIRAAAEDLEPLPTLVALEWRVTPSLTKELEEIRAAMAQAAQSLWPDWYVSADKRLARSLQRFTGSIPTRGDPNGPVAGSSMGWFNEAWHLCQKGKTPLVAHMTASEQVRQLSLALDPSRLVIALSVESAEASSARIRGLAKAAEWLSQETRSKTFLLLPRQLDGRPELDHVNYQAFFLGEDKQSSAIALAGISELKVGSRTKTAEAPQVIVGPVMGRPHPGSEIEQLMHDIIGRDPELSTLLEYNQRLTAHGDKHYIVDLLWRKGGVVIEFDGPEHRGQSRYLKDRDRDYRLLLAGYTTLRITNEEVCVDASAAVNKIRTLIVHRQQQLKAQP